MPMAEASKSVGADSIRPKKIAILVAGMHRSGTSTTTRILNLLGCDLPRTPLVVPDSYKKFNEKGHWESERVKDLNDEILSSAGSSWDDWRVFDAGWYAAPVAEQFRERAQRLLHEEFGDSRLFVLKDPRICRLLKFWIEEVRNFGAEPCVVSPIRNPLEVGSSLETRDGIDASIGHLLWLRHVLNAERASRDVNRAYVSYDTLLTDTHAVVDTLARTLGISWPKRGAISSQMGVDEFVSPALRHHRSDDIGFLTNPRISRWVTTSFEIFDRWSRTDIRTTDTGELDEIRAAFDESAFAFSRALAVGSNAAATLKERDGQLETLNQIIAEHRKQIGDLHQTVADRDERIGAAQATLKERDGQLTALNRAVTDRDRWLADLHTSNSWRMTAPLRRARRASLTVFRKSRSLVSRTVRTLYRRAPLPFRVKLRLKDQLFRRLPFLFRHTWVYRTWKTIDQDTPTSMPARFSSSQTETQGDHAVSQYVARTLDEIDPETLAVRLIAFYLPQFHPIRENDEWWGRGFTEWTNVVKAQPNFEGHYQPRLPADLGFYDLRVAEVMEQQAELARQYGIYGFCYHYYWFGGKRLLEMPLERMLRTGKPNFPFCLSWANENWTRRWDGLEHEVLIAQQHSDEDDVAVMSDLIRYFRHPNYIRINGKPLLLTYRIESFPNIQHTVERWRELCQKDGVGEIYLAMVESFEQASANDDPKIYGFDASVEYPPHHMFAPIEAPGPMLNSAYVGLINDYREIVISYLQKNISDHTKFRGIMPDWDNTARKQNHAHIFHHSSPDAYQRWLQAIIEQTRERYMGDERIVFINAWNEWAEGAHLEPDRRYGHAYLQATRSALEQVGQESSGEFSQPLTVRSEHPQRDVTTSRPPISDCIEEINSKFEKKSEICIVFHIYYEDVVEGILSEYLYPIRNDIDALITTSESISIETVEKLKNHLPNLHISTSENRGRDIRPFLQIYPFIFEKHYEICCKIHTKKSIHRIDGESLRRHALDSLLKCNIDEIVQQFSQDEELGMIVPPDTFLYLSENSDWYDNNRPWLDELLTRMGARDQIGKYQFDFPAGSMYWFRVASLTKLLDRQFIDLDEFEPEAGQLDGALQHSVERIISLLVRKAGYKVQIASRIS